MVSDSMKVEIQMVVRWEWNLSPLKKYQPINGLTISPAPPGAQGSMKSGNLLPSSDLLSSLPSFTPAFTEVKQYENSIYYCSYIMLYVDSYLYQK